MMHPGLFLGLVVLAQPALSCVSQDVIWQRAGEPVLRDPIVAENYEVASDAHVIVGADGPEMMIYTGDDQGSPAIKLALKIDADWEVDQVLIGPSVGQPVPINKETPYYRQDPSGEHQMYFIGYADEASYESDVYLAVANKIEGPWFMRPVPVLTRGPSADGKTVAAITSPSVVLHDGQLHMTYLGWNAFPDATEVWVMGAISEDGGRSWSAPREVDAPIGMEGQITRIPDGRFAAARTGEGDGVEGIYLACADHPFGPYEQAENPALTLAGPPWEVNEIIAPQLVFEPDGAPYLFYTGADHAKGWWIMEARPAR